MKPMEKGLTALLVLAVLISIYCMGIKIYTEEKIGAMKYPCPMAK